MTKGVILFFWLFKAHESISRKLYFINSFGWRFLLRPIVALFDFSLCLSVWYLCLVMFNKTNRKHAQLECIMEFLVPLMRSLFEWVSWNGGKLGGPGIEMNIACAWPNDQLTRDYQRQIVEFIRLSPPIHLNACVWKGERERERQSNNFHLYLCSFLTHALK